MMDLMHTTVETPCLLARFVRRRYSVDSLTTLGFMRTVGTVIRSRFIWIQTLLLVLVALGIFVVGTRYSRIFYELNLTSLNAVRPLDGRKEGQG